MTVYYNEEAVTGFPESGFYAALGLSRYNELMEDRGLPLLAQTEVPCPTPNAIVNGPAADGVVVVPDEMLPQLRPRRQMVDINYRGDASQVDSRLRGALEGAEDFTAGLDIMLNHKLDNYYDLMGSKILVLYMGLYLGLVFLLTAAAVLALQQLSQASDNARRYELLSKLGADRTMRRRALVRQVALAFLLPLVLGSIHAFVGMIAATAGLLLVIYGGYFLATCFGAWRAVRTD